MKTQYKILIVYLIVSYILGMYILIVPEMCVIKYHEIDISNPKISAIGRGRVVNFIKDDITYKSYSYLRNGEEIKSGNHFVKSFSKLLQEYNYKKILNVHGVYIENKTANKVLFVKQIDYIDTEGNNATFEIPENLFNNDIKHYLHEIYITWIFFLSIYILAPIYFCRKNISKLFNRFFNKPKGNQL